DSAFLKTVSDRIDSFLVHNPSVKKADIPSELVTASGSGLDPDLSPQGAYVQVARIAKTRNISEEKIKALVAQQIQKPLLGLFGPEKVNVLELNIALDQLKEEKTKLKTMKKILVYIITLIAFQVAVAQTDSTKPAAPTSPAPTITGSVDVYYRYNFNHPKSGATNNYTSFTNSQNSFELGMASIRADHSFGKASATIDLGFGRRAEEFSYANPDHSSLFAVKQAYV